MAKLAFFPEKELPRSRWLKAKRLAPGGEKEKLQAIEILSSGDYRLPEGAEELLVGLAAQT